MKKEGASAESPPGVVSRWISTRSDVAPSRRARRSVRWFAGIVVLGIGYYFSLPAQLFRDPYSTVLEDGKGELLSASIAPDGQWRFPDCRDVPDKFAWALVTYEDQRFYDHPGVDVLALFRAFKQDVAARRIVSGGSTLSMQVIRLSRKGKARTAWEKVIEMLLATRLEWRYSKEEILSLYASHAPFGGNVVGLDAACWRYFGRPSNQLSWGESALLAVLPNAPSMIHPGKNRDVLKLKRNRLLTRMNAAGLIDDETMRLSSAETIPDAPQALPRMAHHLMVRSEQDGHSGTVVKSTIQRELQLQVEAVVKDHHQRLRGAEIHNLAALVLDVESGNTLAYVGNVPGGVGSHESEVDVITAPRSTGSILKPFLYAAMLDDGQILPRTLLPDVPTMINGFVPRNFTRQYDGAVPANEALVRSLNVPAVHLLRSYRYEKFYNLLRGMGMHSLNQPADHYGLSLILGGAEGTLWDIAGMYASMARTLNHFDDAPGSNRYLSNDFRAPRYLENPVNDSTTHVLSPSSYLSAASIYQTFDALTELSRPAEESGWRNFSSSRKIAWKTGTSFGFRDGWAVGVTPTHVVAIWVGNADGEGRPGLTGTDAAAPVMFDVFALLNGHSWFERPGAEMQQVKVCSQSGQRSNDFCPSAYNAWVVKAGLASKSCNYHKRIHLSLDQRYRLHNSCASEHDIDSRTWFVLPPLEEHFYRNRHISFKPLPPFRRDCAVPDNQPVMSLIYPKANTKLLIPRELDGRPGQVVFELAHRNPEVAVYWHIDGFYVGATKSKHVLPVNTAAGRHRLTLVDENGASVQVDFEALPGM
ncbi:penicillin-binding protein 1C [Chryseolinea sp. T2]|uniref:penicillin-binding protein 1C n=1 Tax=Chryseolinea sp. T2 TaxID=3129255 RepID=UPI003077718A